MCTLQAGSVLHFSWSSSPSIGASQSVCTRLYSGVANVLTNPEQLILQLVPMLLNLAFYKWAPESVGYPPPN
jgi:hypothetical protein